MITTRTKALTRLNELEKSLTNIIDHPRMMPVVELSQKYLLLVSEIRKNINYYGDIAHVRDVYDNSLGKVNIKKIEMFIENSRG